VIFTETPLRGAYCVTMKRIADHRGDFARGWCQHEFEAAGLVGRLVQLNVGRSLKRGTLRGMHFQDPPHAEAKLVRCTSGAIFDVIVDLRPDSATHKRWFGIELTSENDRMIYAPPGFAHGYATLSDNAEIYYLTSEFYTPQFARGVRYDDPAFGIDWPLKVSTISEADQQWPAYAL
jgi:dTDP-4-dehydrorhamnose 3,5-epimerase